MLPCRTNSASIIADEVSRDFNFVCQGEHMNCPTCNVELKMTERQGVEIDYCSLCRGVWLDRGELDKIIERAASELQAPAAPVNARTTSGNVASATTKIATRVITHIETSITGVAKRRSRFSARCSISTKELEMLTYASTLPWRNSASHGQCFHDPCSTLSVKHTAAERRLKKQHLIAHSRARRSDHGPPRSENVCCRH